MEKGSIFHQFKNLARTDSVQRVSDLLDSLPAKERRQAVEDIACWLPHESLAGLNELGAYLLSLPDSAIDKLVCGKISSGPGLSCNLVAFLIKHDPGRVERLYRKWLGRGKPDASCHLETELVAHGFSDAIPALEKKARKTKKVGVALALAKNLHRLDPTKYKDFAIEIACEAMGDSWHVRDACEWMIDVLGVSGLPSVLATLEHLDNSFAMSIAQHAVKVLGVEAGPVIELAMKSPDNLIAFGVAQGAVTARLPSDHLLLNQVFARLVDTGSDDAMPAIIALMVRWCPDKLRSLGKRFATHPVDGIRSSFELAMRCRASDSPTEAQPWSISEIDESLDAPELIPYRTVLAHVAKPCLCIKTSQANSVISSDKSKLGGIPEVSATFAWPLDQSGFAFTFVARLAEGDIQKLIPGFEGSLLLFADLRQSNPDGAVVHVPSSAELRPAEIPGTLYHDLKECSMEVIMTRSLPDPADEFESWRFPAEMLRDHQAMRKYREIRESCGGMDNQLPLAVAFAHPHFCQGNPKFVAEQIFTRINVVDGRVQTPPEFQRNTQRWIALFSSWTDDKARLSFHDTGTISFLIAEEDLRANDFSRVSVNIDCM